MANKLSNELSSPDSLRTVVPRSTAWKWTGILTATALRLPYVVSGGLGIERAEVVATGADFGGSGVMRLMTLCEVTGKPEDDEEGDVTAGEAVLIACCEGVRNIRGSNDEAAGSAVRATGNAERDGAAE